MKTPKFFALVFLAAPLLAAPEPVHVQQGLLTGVPGKNAAVRVYKGIPYAAPPTGDRRWKPPVPPAGWSGTRQATEFSKACWQQPYAQNSVYYRPAEPMSEDCLYLNVWTAAASFRERRPVMVWIHGGALTRGSGSLATYDGEALAAKGVVLVTINYRLNVFGLLAHPELTSESDRHASGNYAFLDQIAALEWVKHNIAAFGGDPNHVTIFGESAGSWSVNYLMATPLARGLFQRVIGESGGAFAPMKTLAETEQLGAKLGTLKELRELPAEQLLSKAASVPLSPNVDGWMLPQDVYSIFAAGKQNDVPLLAGSNADEATTLSPWPPNGTADAFAAQIRKRFGDLGDDALKIYPADNAEHARESHLASFRDFIFGWQMRTWARMQTQTGKSKAWLYYFSRVAPGSMAKLGAFHAGEIAYVFGNLEPGGRSFNDADRKLSDEMSSYWVNFAATGNPNGKGLPQWPAYEATKDVEIEFGDTVHPVTALHQNALDLIDRYYAAERKAVATR